MKIAATLVLLGAMAMVACTQKDEPAFSLPAGTLDAWTTAFNSGDQEGLLATYTADTVLMPPNAQQVTGHEGVLQIFGEGLKGGLYATQTTETLEVRGDMAFRAGTFTLADSKGAEIDRGKFIELWRKDAQGNWKMSHDMWNSSNPVAPAAEPAAATPQPK